MLKFIVYRHNFSRGVFNSTMLLPKDSEMAVIRTLKMMLAGLALVAALISAFFPAANSFAEDADGDGVHAGSVIDQQDYCYRE